MTGLDAQPPQVAARRRRRRTLSRPHRARQRLALAGLSIAVAACTPAPPPDLAGAPPPLEINQPGELTSRLAYATCLEYHRLDAKACLDLKPGYRSDLRASLAPAQAPPAPPRPPPEAQADAAMHKKVPYRTAVALYKATSTDAQTFTAALLIPDIRRKVEAALRQSLSDAKLRQMADQAKAESLHWYAEMQRLERSGAAN